LLGIDFGSKRIGVSVSDVDQRMAVPVEIVQRQDAVQVMRRFKMLAIENRAKGLVVGLPVFTSGDEGGGALAARRFGTELAAALQLPVRFWDERYSSSQADELLRDMDLTNKKRKARRDMLAAQIILQSYLDSDDRTGQPKPLHDR
jgi:putative Holliday junction resolvase